MPLFITCSLSFDVFRDYDFCKYIMSFNVVKIFHLNFFFFLVYVTSYLLIPGFLRILHLLFLFPGITTYSCVYDTFVYIFGAPFAISNSSFIVKISAPYSIVEYT